MAGKPSRGSLETALSIMDGSIPQAEVIASQKPWALSPSAYQPLHLAAAYTDRISSQGQECAQALNIHPPFRQLGWWKVGDGFR